MPTDHPLKQLFHNLHGQDQFYVKKEYTEKFKVGARNFYYQLDGTLKISFEQCQFLEKAIQERTWKPQLNEEQSLMEV